MTYQTYCRESKKSSKDGKSPVELCVNDGSARIYIKTAFRYSPAEFERFRNQKKKNEVKEIIASIERHYFKILMELENNNITVNSHNIRENWNGLKVVTIETVTKEYTQILNPRVGTDLCFSQYNKYLAVFQRLNQLDKPIADINENDIEAITTEWSRKYKPSTFNGFYAKLNTFFKYAYTKGYIKRIPLGTVKKKKVHEVVETITDEDYEKIKAHDFVERIERVKEILILLAGTGLSYIDLKQFNPDNIQEQNGVMIYHDKRQKTKQDFYSVILPDALEIFRKYDFKLNIPSNQKLNAYLKEIQHICHISTTLTCHKFRHFYARKMLLMGLPIEVLQKCLGHSNTKQSLHYARLIRNQNYEFVSNAFNKINRENI